MPTKIETFQKSKNRVISAGINAVVYETMIRCAELNGYETVSAFVKDAVLEKIQSTASAMRAIAEEHKSTYQTTN